MRQIIILLAFFPLMLLAEQNESDGSESVYNPLAMTYGIPETNICGVNVINGDYNYACVDFELPGADPLVFQRAYSSSQNSVESFFHGWSHNLSSFVRTGDSFEPFNDSANTFNVILSGSLSGDIALKTETKNRWNDIKINREIFNQGVSNCGKGYLSGRTNIKNLKVNYSETKLTVTNPDGTEHVHEPTIQLDPLPEYCSENRLVKTIKPNGLKRTYKNFDKILHEVKALTHDDRISNQIAFDCPNHYEGLSKKKIQAWKFTINSHSKDGKTAKYHFNCRKKAVKIPHHGKNPGFIISMSGFESSHLPTENYRYLDRDDGHDVLEERSGERHKTTIEYYARGDKVECIGYPSEEISPSHIARNRVKQINIAVNSREDLQMAYRFAYHKDKKTKEAFTEVCNSLNHLTRYQYSTKNYRLSGVEKYKKNPESGEHSLYRRDRLEYGAKRTRVEGDLLFKTIESSDGTIHYGESYDYDERGNVLERRLHYRTFSGSKVRSISPKANPHSIGNFRLRGGTTKSILYTYNALNLTTSEDDGRLKTTFTYDTRNGKESNLLKSKLIQKGQKILKREFYGYDGNAGCTLKIEDDGVTTASDNLTGVKSRKVIHYKNLTDQFAGLPFEIDVWGSNGQNEHRISRTILAYDRHGYVENKAHFDSNNQFAYYTYTIRDLQGNIHTEIDALGQTTKRNYNEYGSMFEERGPSSKYYTEYTYDFLQRPVTVTRKCIDGINLKTSRKYDLEGNLLEIEDPYGGKTEYIYNEQGKPIKIIHPPIRTEKGKWVKIEEVKEYNFLGHLISEKDAKGAITLYTPNDAGLPLKITYPDGTSEEFSYSLYGELLKKTQRNGSTVIYAYDDFSRPILEEVYDRSGNLLKKCSKKYSGLLLKSETDGEGVRKWYEYDYAGRISEVRRRNELTKYTYDSLGRLEGEKRFFGDAEQDYIATRYTYDFLNRVIEKKEIDATGKIHSRIKTGYDCDGNIESTSTWTHAGRTTTTHTYDPRGNLNSTTDPLGNTTYFNHRYDVFFEGNNLPCVEVTDPAGVKTTTISDLHGNVVLTQIHSPFGELLSDTEMFYDHKGNLIRKEQHLPTETIMTRWEFDTASRLKAQINGAGTPEQITTTFVYNSFGEQSETHYADGTSKHRIYDGLGRLLEEWSDDKSVHYQYIYNAQDLLTNALNLNTQKQTVRKYTPEGNLSSEKFENGLRIRYRYDRINRITECIYPDDTSVRQVYNPIFLEKAQRIKNDRVIYSAKFSDFGQSGKPQNINFPRKSGNLKLRYDLLNRPTSLTYPHYKEEEIYYDNRGLLVSKRVNGDLQHYDHDPLQQLVLEKTKLYSHTYENDALHRQISVDGCAQVHNAVHQLTQGVDDSYKFDAKGRRKNDSSTKYTYDRFDRLIKVEQDGSTWSYTYDAFNRKMSRTVYGETTYYLYDGHEDIGSYDTKQKCIDLKILSAQEGSIPIAIELKGKQYTPHISSQGHIVGLVEMNTGKLADESFLTLFGRDLSDKPLSPWRFCGKRHENALGIIDFGYRFYHPKTAQWLTQDPIGESDGPNLYAYVRNNPACHVDRFGLFGEGFSFSDVCDSISETWSNCWNDDPDYGCSTQDIAAENCSISWEPTLNVCSNTLGDEIQDNQSPSYAEQGLSLTLDCMPGVSTVKSACELVLGSDLVTGEETSRLNSVLGLIPCAKILTNAGKGVKKIYDVSSKTISAGLGAIRSSFRSRGAESVQAGIQIFKNEITEKIGSRVTGYTKHGLQQAIGRNEGRGVSPNIILDILKNPKKVIDHGDSIKFVGKNGGGVVVNLEGKIITTFGSSRGPKIWDWGKCK